MKIALVSRSDSSSGGAGRVAEQLCLGLRARGYDVTHFLRWPPKPEYADSADKIFRLRGDVLMRNLVDADVSGLLLLLKRKLWDADLVHFHDHVVAYGARVALRVARRRPTIITLHDFSGLTGGCMNPRHCLRYQVGCGDCWRVGEWPLQSRIDRTRQQFKLHEKVAREPNCLALSPSEYLKACAVEGAWREGDIRVVPNGVDTAVFSPERREEGRARLGLSEKAKALLFIATSVRDPGKGYDDLEQAYLQLAPSHEDLHLILVGNMPEPPKRLADFSERVHVCGMVTDDLDLAGIFAAADCLVAPTYQDNFPMTVLEALSTGTPVVATPVGGIPEMIGIGPWATLVDKHDPSRLAQAILTGLERASKSGVRQAARDRAVRLFSVEQMLDSHEAIYESHLSGCAGRAR